MIILVFFRFLTHALCSVITCSHDYLVLTLYLSGFHLPIHCLRLWLLWSVSLVYFRADGVLPGAWKLLRGRQEFKSFSRVSRGTALRVKICRILGCTFNLQIQFPLGSFFLYLFEHIFCSTCQSSAAGTPIILMLDYLHVCTVSSIFPVCFNIRVFPVCIR